MYGGFCGLWALMNGDGDGVADARPQTISELAPANWGWFVVSLYA